MPASILENNATATIAGREMIVTRLFDVSPELVFDAWTDPKHIVYWYGPLGFRTTIQKMDVRPGGEWLLVMHGPDGRDYRNRMVYVDVDRPHRLSYWHEPDEGCEPVFFDTAVTFEARDGKTLLTLTHTFPTVAVCEEVEAKYHAVEGGKQTFARLADYLPIQVAGKPEREIVITRVFDAPREVVFRAWTQAKELEQWWGPKLFTNADVTCDARVGGAWHVTMFGPNGVEYPCGGVYREVVAPELLDFTNDATDDAGNVIIQGVTRVSFAEYEGGQTLLTLTTRATAMIEPMISGLMGMHAGWSQSLDKLFDLTSKY